jgi:hypothetical protein
MLQIFESWVVRVLLVLLVVAFAAAVVQTERLAAAREQGMRAAWAADTVQAAADTTRDIYIDAAVLGDSLRLVQRRAVQVTQRADELDRKLGLERVARDELQATIAELNRASIGSQVAAPVDDSVRTGTFEVRAEPYTVLATVALPRPPARGRLDVDVRLDTLPLEIRLGCGSPGKGGVRPASVTAVGPAWAKVKLGRVEQAPAVCADISASSAPSLLRRLADRVGVFAGYAAARRPDGVIVGGLALGVGARIWP